MLGIGNRPKLDWFEVKWPQPSNAINRLPDLRVNRHITIMEGQGWVEVMAAVHSAPQ